MITSGLYQNVLITPAVNGSDELFVISGYASATFTRRHLTDLKERVPNFKLHLVIGMPGKRVDHAAYLQLHHEFSEHFTGYYLTNNPPVHSKAFSWFSSGQPSEGYSGSANYSQFGFFEDKQINQMTQDDPVIIKNFFDELIQRSVPMLELELADLPSVRPPSIHGSLQAGTIEWIEPGKSVRISFLDRHGQLPAVSGLNWGQRQERRTNHETGEVTMVSREPNQAYLSLKGDSRREGFLPPRAYNFTLITDDGQSFDCVRAQDGDKAIHSTKDNSELGKYFRHRLGLAEGAFITIHDLERYGRTDYTITKIDDENFLLDFSRPT